MTLPNNVRIDPVTKYDLGDLGSLGNYRTNSTLNQIENRVMRDMTARNKTLIDAIKADPTTTNSLMLTLGQGLSEDRTRRELTDLRNAVRGNEVERTRTKAFKAQQDKNIREVNSIIKAIAPNLQGRLDPNALLAQFQDPRTGGINRMHIVKFLDEESASFEKGRPQTPEMRQAIAKQMAQVNQLIADAEEAGDLNMVAKLVSMKEALGAKLGGPGANIGFTPGAGEQIKTDEWFDGKDAVWNFKTNIKMNINGQETVIPVDVENPPTLNGNTLTYDGGEAGMKTIKLNQKQVEAYKNALAQANKAHSISYDKEQPEGFSPYDVPDVRQAQTDDEKKPLPLIGQDQVQATETTMTDPPVNKKIPPTSKEQVLEALKKQRKDQDAYRKKNEMVGGVPIAETPITKGGPGDLIGLPYEPLEGSTLDELKKTNPKQYAEVMQKIASGISGSKYPRKVGTQRTPEEPPVNITPDTPITTVSTGDGSNLRPEDKLAGIGNTKGYDASSDPAVIQRQVQEALASMGKGERRKFPNLTKELMGHTPDGRPIWKNETDAEGWDSESSERAITFKHDGKYYSYPTIFNNRMKNGNLVPMEVSPEQAISLFIEYGHVDPETGVKSKGFDSMDEAVAYARDRSSHLGDLIVRPKEKSSTPSSPNVASIEREPRSTYSRADADEQQRKDRGELTIEEENLARVQKQMARANQGVPEASWPERASNALDDIRNRFTGSDKAVANDVPGPEKKTKELSDEQKRNMERTALQDARGNSGNDNRSFVGKVGGWIDDKSNRMDSAIGSAQEKIVKQAKEFMAYEGVSGLSGDEAMDWVMANRRKFKEWREKHTGADPVGARFSAEKMQSERTKSGIDKPYLKSVSERNSKNVFKRDEFLPEGKLGNSFRRGITLAGKNGKAKNIRPGFMYALASTENAKFDPKALGIEKDKKTGQNVPGGKVQGLGMVQMTVDTAKGTDLGKTSFKGKSDKEIAKMLKSDPDLNIAISTQFSQQIYNVFKNNKYTKSFSPFEMEMLIGIAYNNRGESFQDVVNKIKPKNLKDLLNKADLEKQTRNHIPRLRSNLNKQRKTPQYVSGKPKEKSFKDKLLAPFS